MNLWIEIAITGSVLACALPATIFPFAYHLTARWWETPYGRNLMGFGVAIMLLIDLTVLFAVVMPPLWVGAIVQVLVFGFTAVVMWHRIALLMKAQHPKEKK